MRAHRLEQILQLINQRGEISVREIAGALSVPEPTVRRDLRLLDEQRRIRRRYGMAQMLPPEETAPRRLSLAAEEAAVADAAMNSIMPGNVIILPRGPINGIIAERVRDSSHISVITNSCGIFHTVKQNPRIHLISLGGIYNPIGDCTYGQMAENALLEIRADLLLLEPSGIDAEEGITYENMVEVPLVKKMIRAARRVALIAGPGVLGKTSGAVVSPLDSCSALLTSGPVPEDFRRTLAERRIELICPGEAP